MKQSGDNFNQAVGITQFCGCICLIFAAHPGMVALTGTETLDVAELLTRTVAQQARISGRMHQQSYRAEG
jgi:hypothetical protein